VQRRLVCEGLLSPDRYAPGVYGLRGAEIPPGLADTVMPRSPRLRALQDHGRLSDDTVWVAYRLTASTIRSGVVNIPAGLKELLAGTFTLKAEDEADIGIFSIRHHTGWGLQPYFRRRPTSRSIGRGCLSREASGWSGPVRGPTSFRP